MVLERAAKAALGVNLTIAENDCPRSDIFVGDFDNMAEGSSIAGTTLREGFAENGDKFGFKEAVAHRGPTEQKRVETENNMM